MLSAHLLWHSTAGRRVGKAYAVLILGVKPIDQYVGINPDWLIGTSPENAIIDKNNLHIQLSHIRAAAAELPLTIDDIGYFPDLGEILPLLQEIGEIEEIHNTFHWKGKSSPAHEFSLRNITNETVEVVDDKNKITLTTMDLQQAKRELYTGAIYLHDTIQYKCLQLNLETKIATVIPADLNYYTDPYINRNIDILVKHKEKAVDRANVFFGDVRVSTMVLGYKMMQFNTHQNLGYEALSEPLEDEMDTEGCWIQLPNNVVVALQTAIEQSATKTALFDYFKAIVHSLKSVAELKVMATFTDIGGSSFGFINQEEQIRSDAVILYDQYPGGLGFSEKVFEHIKEIIKNATYLVKNCCCKTGCPACIGNYKIDKEIILWALENFFIETNPPEHIIIPEEPKIEQIKYKYTWDKIVEDWMDLVELMKKHKIYGANFLSTAKSISVENTSLILYFPISVVKIAAKDEIKQAISNSLAQFMRLPKGFSLSFESIDSTNENRKYFKLMRHFKSNRE